MTLPSVNTTVFPEIAIDETAIALPLRVTVKALLGAVIVARLSASVYVRVSKVPAVLTAAVLMTGAVESRATVELFVTAKLENERESFPCRSCTALFE
jgi:hypothetical protein